MRQELIAVILPTRNEESAIGKTIDEIRALPIKPAIMVTNGESEDETTNIAVWKGATVLHCGRGKGIAVKEALTRIRADYIFMLDADYTYPAEAMIPMLDMLRGGQLLPRYDAVYGWRHNIENGAMTKWHKAGNRLLTLLANMLYSSSQTHDLCSGMWGFTKETAEFLAGRLSSKGFTLEADIYTSLVLSKRSIGYVKIDYRKRIGEKPKLKFWDAFRITWFLIRRRFNKC